MTNESKGILKPCKWIDIRTRKRCGVMTNDSSGYCSRHLKMIEDMQTAYILRCQDCPVGTAERCSYYNRTGDGTCYFEQLAIDAIDFEDIYDTIEELVWVLRNLKILLSRQYRLATRDGIVDEKTFNLSEKYCTLINRLIEIKDRYGLLDIQSKRELDKKLIEVFQLEEANNNSDRDNSSNPDITI